MQKESISCNIGCNFSEQKLNNKSQLISENILRSFRNAEESFSASFKRVNRPFPSSKKFHFQNEAKCETFVVEMSFNYDANKTHFHNKDFALSLVLKVKLFGTRKWPVKKKRPTLNNPADSIPAKLFTVLIIYFFYSSNLVLCFTTATFFSYNYNYIVSYSLLFVFVNGDMSPKCSFLANY